MNKYMKTELVILLAAILCTSGFAQTGGGSGSAATGGAGGAATGSAGTGGTGGRATPVAPGPGSRVAPQPLPPGQNTPQQPVNPNLPQNPNPNFPQNPNAPQPGQPIPGQNQFVGTNAGITPLDTNQLAQSTNQFGTNQFGTNVTPTSLPGLTNRIMATNASGLPTNNSRLMHDQALSDSDRRLLSELRTAVYGASQRPAPLSGTVVNFILRDGVVRLVGIVPNAEEQKRIESIVQQIPGVVRVYDALQIGVQAEAGQQNPASPPQEQQKR